jgi:hypothetical protein
MLSEVAKEKPAAEEHRRDDRRRSRAAPERPAFRQKNPPPLAMGVAALSLSYGPTLGLAFPGPAGLSGVLRIKS